MPAHRGQAAAHSVNQIRSELQPLLGNTPRMTVRTISEPEWESLADDLERVGWARLPGLLSAAACSDVEALYDQPASFRKRVVMHRHGYGAGEYQYFANPLPPIVQGLRESFYARLAPIAQQWADRLKLDRKYPAKLGDYAAQCRQLGQAEPTPLLLKYGAGDYNRLHQDLYGAEVFPLQVAVLLSQPERDFEGGEFVLTEQRAHQQSRAHVVPLRQGDAVVFPVQLRPMAGKRGDVARECAPRCVDNQVRETADSGHHLA